MQFIKTLILFVIISGISSLIWNKKHRKTYIKPKYRALFYDWKTISLIKALARKFVKNSSSKGNSQKIGLCISKLKENRRQYTTILRNFWENMRKIFERKNYKIVGYWKILVQKLERLTIMWNKRRVFCSRLFNDRNSVTRKEIHDILKMGDYYGQFVKPPSPIPKNKP